MLTEVIYNKLAELIDSNQFQEALLLTTILRELRRSVNVSTIMAPQSKPILGSIKAYAPQYIAGEPKLTATYSKEFENRLKQQVEQGNFNIQLQQPVKPEPSKYEWADGYTDPREDYWRE